MNLPARAAGGRSVCIASVTVKKEKRRANCSTSLVFFVFCFLGFTLLFFGVKRFGVFFWSKNSELLGFFFCQRSCQSLVPHLYLEFSGPIGSSLPQNWISTELKTGNFV